MCCSMLFSWLLVDANLLLWLLKGSPTLDKCCLDAVVKTASLVSFLAEDVKFKLRTTSIRLNSLLSLEDGLVSVSRCKYCCSVLRFEGSLWRSSWTVVCSSFDSNCKHIQEHVVYIQLMGSWTVEVKSIFVTTNELHESITIFQTFCA